MPGITLSSRHVLAAAALLAGLALAPAARADTPKSTDEARSWAQLQTMEPMAVMHMCDREGKGFVTRAEFLAFTEKLFDRMDQDRDGKASPQEWMSGTTTR